MFTPKVYLSIEPRKSITAGTQRFAETSLDQRQRVLGRGKAAGTTTVTTHSPESP